MAELESHEIQTKKSTKETLKNNELTCSLCEKTKPVDQYFKNRAKKTGYDNYCKICRRVVERDYYARLYKDPKSHERRKKTYRRYYQLKKMQSKAAKKEKLKSESLATQAAQAGLSSHQGMETGGTDAEQTVDGAQ